MKNRPSSTAIRHHPRYLFASGLAFLALAASSTALADVHSQRAKAVMAGRDFAGIQFPFVANQGQMDRRIKFYAQTYAGTVSVTEAGDLIYFVPKATGKDSLDGLSLREVLIGSKDCEIVGERRTLTTLNYFRGKDSSKWRRDLPTYESVSLGERYPGIEVKLVASRNSVEKVFYIKPGAMPETIRVQLPGETKLKVNRDGELDVQAPLGNAKFTKPVGYQLNAENREFVDIDYEVQGRRYDVREYSRP